MPASIRSSVLLWFLLALARDVAAAPTDPAAACIAARARAAAKQLDRSLLCHARAAQAGSAVDPACVERARQAAVRLFAAATASGGCPATVFDDASNAAYLARRAAVLGNSMRPTAGPSLCQSAKIRAAGRRAADLLLAHARQRLSPDGGQTAARAAVARGRFLRAFARAEAAADCQAAGDAPMIAGAVDSLIDPVAGRIALVVHETVVTASPAEPPNTPGSPGVPASANAKLLAQFGDAAFSLNHATYTRWRFGGPVIAPDAVLIAIPGFGAGAATFAVLAENLITRALEDHGMVVEVWGHDRRTEQLEDRAGVGIATALRDPLVALDWFYGGELGLTLHPALAAGPNRRAVFYNTTGDVPFIANWTPLVFSRDIDAVVEAARATARNANVFLAGHSAGTGFAARYAATDLNLSGSGAADPGYAKLRGLVLLEGTGGSTAGAALSEDSLDRIEAKFDGGLFGAVRDGAPRCVDGLTPCTVAGEASDCAALSPPVCTPPIAAHGVLLNLSPKVLATAEPTGVQGLGDPDSAQAIVQVDQGMTGSSALNAVPELAILKLLPPGTVEGLFGAFLDDESLTASVAPAFATSVGAPGPTVDGLTTWADRDESELWPTCPAMGCPTPDNGPPPTALPGTVWGTEIEAVRMDRLRTFFAGLDGVNATDWYYPISGLSVLSAAGVCQAGACSKGNVGAPCGDDAACAQAVSLDSTALSVGRGRRDIENLTQAAHIDIPVLGVAGSNGLITVPGRFTALAQSLGTCAAASCDGTPRVVDAANPNPAFPTFGGRAGGFEVVTAEGFAHVDVLAGEDDARNPVVAALAAFMARHAP